MHRNTKSVVYNTAGEVDTTLKSAFFVKKLKNHVGGLIKLNSEVLTKSFDTDWSAKGRVCILAHVYSSLEEVYSKDTLNNPYANLRTPPGGPAWQISTLGNSVAEREASLNQSRKLKSTEIEWPGYATVVFLYETEYVIALIHENVVELL